MGVDLPLGKGFFAFLTVCFKAVLEVVHLKQRLEISGKALYKDGLLGFGIYRFNYYKKSSPSFSLWLGNTLKVV